MTPGRKIVEYDLIKDTWASSVVREVNKKLSAGWELYGPTLMESTTIVQAMVRYEDAPGVVGEEL